MNEISKQRDAFHTQLTSFQHVFDQLQQENKSLKDEVNTNIHSNTFHLLLVKDQFKE